MKHSLYATVWVFTWAHAIYVCLAPTSFMCSVMLFVSETTVDGVGGGGGDLYNGQEVKSVLAVCGS